MTNFAKSSGFGIDTSALTVLALIFFFCRHMPKVVLAPTVPHDPLPSPLLSFPFHLPPTPPRPLPPLFPTPYFLPRPPLPSLPFPPSPSHPSSFSAFFSPPPLAPTVHDTWDTVNAARIGVRSVHPVRPAGSHSREHEGGPCRIRGRTARVKHQHFQQAVHVQHPALRLAHVAARAGGVPAVDSGHALSCCGV